MQTRTPHLLVSSWLSFSISTRASSRKRMERRREEKWKM